MVDFYQKDPVVLSALNTHMEINIHFTLVFLSFCIAVWKLEPKASEDPVEKLDVSRSKAS